MTVRRGFAQSAQLYGEFRPLPDRARRPAGRPRIWQVLGVFFVGLGIAVVVDGVLGYAIASGLHGWIEVWLAGIVDGLIFSSVLVAVSTALYYELSDSDPGSEAIRRTRSSDVQR